MNAPRDRTQSVRGLVAKLWAALSALVRAFCNRWPRRNAPEHVALAQLGLEIERARRNSEEKRGNR